MKNYCVLVLSVLALLLLPAASWGDESGGKVTKGTITVERGAGKLTLREGGVLSPGDLLAAARDASFSFGGAAVEMKAGSSLRLGKDGGSLQLVSGAVTVKAGESSFGVRFAGGLFYCSNGAGYFRAAAGEDEKNLVYSAAGSMVLVRAAKDAARVKTVPAGCYLRFDSNPYGASPVAVSKVDELPAELDRSLVLGGGAGGESGGGFGRFLSSSGDVSVGRPDFDGRLRPGDRITLGDGATAELAVPGGIIKVTGPASFVLRKIVDPSTGRETVLVSLMWGRIMVEKTGDLPIYLQAGALRARILGGALECTRPHKRKKIRFRQHGGKSEVTPLGDIPSSSVDTSGGAKAEYRDGKLVGLTLEDDQGFSFNKAGFLPPKDGEKAPFTPPAAPETPDPKDVSPH